MWIWSCVIGLDWDARQDVSRRISPKTIGSYPSCHCCWILSSLVKSLETIQGLGWSRYGCSGPLTKLPPLMVRASGQPTTWHSHTYKVSLLWFRHLLCVHALFFYCTSQCCISHCATFLHLFLNHKIIFDFLINVPCYYYMIALYLSVKVMNISFVL